MEVSLQYPEAFWALLQWLGISVDGFDVGAGRVDDVINVSGHRIGTAEVESALVNHPACAEAAVVPVEHPIKGQGIYAFITLMEVSLALPCTLPSSLVHPVNSLLPAAASCPVQLACMHACCHHHYLKQCFCASAVTGQRIGHLLASFSLAASDKPCISKSCYSALTACVCLSVSVCLSVVFMEDVVCRARVTAILLMRA
jgi:hypothetical protein